MSTQRNSVGNHGIIRQMSVRSSDLQVSKHLLSSRNNKCLNFNADRLVTEDWNTLLEALRNNRKLHSLSIKSEYQTKQRRISNSVEKPAIYKQEVLNNFTESLLTIMRKSVELVSLQLQALPFDRNNIEMISSGVKECTTLQNLLLTRFALCDDGLHRLYDSIYPHLSLVLIDFTGCCLTSRGAQTIAKIIRIQRIARYEETWKQSLRYRVPDESVFPGIRRIVLNNNPEIGDEGFSLICHELLDDLWITSINMQNCGLSTLSENEAMELLKVNKTLTVLDIRKNDKISNEMSSKIKIILTQRAQNNKTHMKDNSVLFRRNSYDWSEDCNKPDVSISHLDITKQPNSETSVNKNSKLTKTNVSYNPAFLNELTKAKVQLNNTKRDLEREKSRNDLLAHEKQRLKEHIDLNVIKEWAKRKIMQEERNILTREKKSVNLFNKASGIKRLSMVASKSKEFIDISLTNKANDFDIKHRIAMEKELEIKKDKSRELRKSVNVIKRYKDKSGNYYGSFKSSSTYIIPKISDKRKGKSYKDIELNLNAVRKMSQYKTGTSLNSLKRRETKDSLASEKRYNRMNYIKDNINNEVTMKPEYLIASNRKSEFNVPQKQDYKDDMITDMNKNDDNLEALFSNNTPEPKLLNSLKGGQANKSSNEEKGMQESQNYVVGTDNSKIITNKPDYKSINDTQKENKSGSKANDQAQIIEDALKHLHSIDTNTIQRLPENEKTYSENAEDTAAIQKTNRMESSGVSRDLSPTSKSRQIFKQILAVKAHY